MEPDCIFLENMAETLTAVLRKNGFRPKKVLVTEEQNGKGRRVRLTLGTCGGKGLCRSQVLPLKNNGLSNDAAGGQPGRLPL